MDNRVFLDTSYVLARLFSTDRHHARAVLLDAEIRSAPVSIITSRAVCLELGAALSKPELRALGIGALEGLEQDPRVSIQPLTEPLYAKASQLFASRPDKGWTRGLRGLRDYAGARNSIRPDSGHPFPASRIHRAVTNGIALGKTARVGRNSRNSGAFRHMGACVFGGICCVN